MLKLLLVLGLFGGCFVDVWGSLGRIWNPSSPGTMWKRPPNSNHFRRGRMLSNRFSEDGGNINSVKFYSFPNPQSHDELQEIRVEDPASWTQLKWKRNAQTKFLVHGFIQNLTTVFPQNVKNAYLRRMREGREEWNVVVVDWGELAYSASVALHLPIYTRAVDNVPRVGQRLANLIQNMVERKLIPSLDRVHLIGQSLGAHVVGNAAHFLQDNFSKGGKIGRISGLDPAGPLFYTGLWHGARKLESSDAKFLDIYHCNPGALGMEGDLLGDVQFYPNSLPLKNIQPQCTLFSSNEELNLCSHNYCPKFFAYAILHPVEAVKCAKRSFILGPLMCQPTDKQFYGEDVELSARGRYFATITQNLDDMSIFT